MECVYKTTGKIYCIFLEYKVYQMINRDRVECRIYNFRYNKRKRALRACCFELCSRVKSNERETNGNRREIKTETEVEPAGGWGRDAHSLSRSQQETFGSQAGHPLHRA